MLSLELSGLIGLQKEGINFKAGLSLGIAVLLKHQRAEGRMVRSNFGLYQARHLHAFSGPASSHSWDLSDTSVPVVALLWDIR